MTTINAVGVGLSGASGTGSFAGTNSPVLVTPTLGAANATSINFGGSTLSTYSALQSWTPVFTFSTLGDLSVSYATQTGSYTQIGDVVVWSFVLACTPTFTTSSGNVQITGLPTNAALNCFGSGLTSSVTFPVGTTSLCFLVPSGHTYVQILGSGTGAGAANLVSTNFTSGVQVIIEATGTYLV